MSNLIKKDYKIIIAVYGSGDFIFICNKDIVSEVLKHIKDTAFDNSVFNLKENTLLEILKGIATDCISGVYIMNSEGDLDNFIDEGYDVLTSIDTWGEFLDLFEE